MVFRVPSTAWTVQITDAYEFEAEVWIVARVSASSEFGAAVISTVTDSITIPDTAKDVKYFILGKTWNWENSPELEPYEFVKENDEQQFETKLKSGKRIDVVRDEQQIPIKTYTSVSVSLEVPSPLWTVKITDIYEFKTEIWIAARVSGTLEGGLKMFTAVDTVTIPSTTKDIKYFILGKTTDIIMPSGNPESYEFVKANDEKQFDTKLKRGEKIDFIREQHQEAPHMTTTTVSVTLQVPSTAWTVKITDVYEFETKVWVAARVSTISEVGLTVISTVSDSVTIPDTSKDVRYFILGKTWGWESSEPYEFVKASDEKQFELKLKNGKKINFVQDE